MVRVVPGAETAETIAKTARLLERDCVIPLIVALNTAAVLPVNALPVAVSVMVHVPETVNTAGEHGDAVTPEGRMLVIAGVTVPVKPVENNTVIGMEVVAPCVSEIRAGVVILKVATVRVTAAVRVILPSVPLIVIWPGPKAAALLAAVNVMMHEPDVLIVWEHGDALTPEGSALVIVGVTVPV